MIDRAIKHLNQQAPHPELTLFNGTQTLGSRFESDAARGQAAPAAGHRAVNYSSPKNRIFGTLGRSSVLYNSRLRDIRTYLSACCGPRAAPDLPSLDFSRGCDRAHATRTSAACMVGASPVGGNVQLLTYPDLCFSAVKNHGRSAKISDRQISFSYRRPTCLAFGRGPNSRAK